jgi:hypothetical protein
MKKAVHVARMQKIKNAFETLNGRSEGDIPLGRIRRTQEDNIKINLKEIQSVLDSPD